MKKIFTLLLAAAMVFATVFSVFAAETEEMKAVLQQVKARIGSTDGYSNFYSESEDDEFFGTVYRFEWTISDDGAVLCINAAADGTILSYIIYGDEKTEEIPISQTLTKAELKEAAHGFIKQLNPEIADSFKPESVTFYRRFADVTFSEYKNGYPIKDSYASLEITKDGKKLRSLLLNYEGGKDFETGNIISKADAVKSFSEKLGLELYYDVTREWDDALSKHKTTVTPTYSPKDTDKFISAINGDVFEESGSLSAVYGANYKFDDMESSSAEDSAGGFSQAEIIEIENTEGLISKEKAFEILKNASCLDFPDITISDVTARLSRNDFNNSKEYSFSYRKTNGKITSLMNARVNAESGEILSLNIRELGGTESEAEEISNEKTIKIAEKAIKELAPKKHSEYELSSNLTDSGCCTFIRHVNGVPVYADTANVAINPENGKLISWEISYTNEVFPALESIISKDEAEKIFFENAEYTATYIYDYENSMYKLCYVPEDLFAQINPFTGEYKDHSNADVSEFSDISDHYAKDTIIALSESNIGFSGDTLNPDQPIKQKEFAALLQDVVKHRELQCVIDENYDYEGLYRYIKFIPEDEKDPEGNVTRLDAAKFTVSAMGYSQIAELDVFKPMFSDVSNGVGYVSILSGMKILNGDGNGHFNPDGVLTRAQALIIIYNYLNK